jgi:hypothetical protein
MTALNVVPTILTDVQIGISQALETINTPKTLAAEFYGALINQTNTSHHSVQAQYRASSHTYQKIFGWYCYGQPCCHRSV